MLEVLSAIFGSGEVIKKSLELIDEAWTSDEEKAQNQAKLIEVKTRAKMELISAYAPFKLAQRYLAVMFTVVFLFIMANGVLGALYGWVNMDNVHKALDFANKMWLGEIMMAIVSFYFGGGFIESLNKKEKHET